MPHETSFFSYLVAMFPALGKNIDNLGRIGHSAFNKPVGIHSIEPVFASAFVVLLVIGLGALSRGAIRNVDEAVIPEDKLTIRSFMENFVGALYNMMKDMMGPKRAKRYFPLVGTCGCFVFFSNILGLFPGLVPPTATLNTTAAAALVVFISFNYYGIKENGFGYFKHLAGPVWWLAPLILLIEVISLCIRPVTLSVRLMLNMAVDHLLATIATGMVMLFVPIPILMLSTLVCVVQVVVFCLLTSIYIALATEHEEHEASHGHAHAHDAAPHAAHA
jgi:F-type H+-transporting ATPase subunit a